MDKSKVDMIKFLNYMCRKSGVFCIDPESEEVGYKHCGGVINIPSEALVRLYKIVVKQAKLTIENNKLEAEYHEWGSIYLEGEIIRQHGSAHDLTDTDSR